MLSTVVRRGFGSFNILNSIKNFKNILKAPIKHFKVANEAGGQDYSTQTNTTEEAFDEVSQEWQTLVASNPYDLQTFNYLQNSQLMNFGTVDNPLVIFTADAPFRFVCCTGPQNEDDYEGHQPMWIMLREGPLQRCGVCGQVFKLVRLRNEISSEMDYYIPNFHPYEYQDMGEHDIISLLSPQKMNTHYEYTYHETPEDSYYSMVNPDDHDRILVDPAYRMHRLTLAEEKVKVVEHTMKLLDDENEKDHRFREPISKVDYENLIDVEVAIKKLDRNFRKVAKFQSRKFVDYVNHSRREKRMRQRQTQRLDGGYTLFTGGLTEEEQLYKDYFETELQNYPEDEVVEEHLDRENLLSKARYNLNRFDFQEEYVIGNEDDQSSYLEKKIFKFKYRRALDSSEDYGRRNERMIGNQSKRFDENNTIELIQNYLEDPETYQEAYLEMVQKESLKIYNDYFESDKDENFQLLTQVSPGALVPIFENFQLSKRNRGSFFTFQKSEWDPSRGWWANALNMLGEFSRIVPHARVAGVKTNLYNISEQTKLLRDAEQKENIDLLEAQENEAEPDLQEIASEQEDSKTNGKQ